MYETSPDVPRFRRLFWCDSEMDPSELDANLAWYRRMTQRLLFARGGGVLMSKNPLFTPKLAGLRRAFPDARFVVLVRDPRRVLPSTESLLHFGLQGSGAIPPGERRQDMVTEVCRRFYDHPEAVLADLPADRHAVVRYEDLVADLRGTVTRLLEGIGMAVSPALSAAITEAEDRTHRSAHRYPLGDWGNEVLAGFSDVAERYGYGASSDVRD